MGFKAPKGFWATNPIRAPRILRSSRWLSFNRSRPSKMALPSTTRPGGRTSPRIDRTVTDLPDPVSPTRPTARPRRMRKPTPWTTRFPLNSVFRPETVSRSSLIREPPLDTVGQQVERRYRREHRDARSGSDPPLPQRDVCATVPDHRSPGRLRRGDSHAEEVESRDDDDGVRRGERHMHQAHVDHIEEHVTEKHSCQTVTYHISH